MKFVYRISDRFADYVAGSVVHVSKYFEFFELARFDVLRLFREYLSNQCKADNLSDCFFVVVKVDFSEMCILCKGTHFWVETELLIDKIPVLEFRQSIRSDTDCYCEASIKTAIVSNDFQLVHDSGNILKGQLEDFLCSQQGGDVGCS